MSRPIRRTALLLVGIQVVLLLALVLVPAGDAWTRTPLVGWLSTVLVGVGTVLGLGAGWQIRAGLTVVPIPTPGAVLRTDGLYRLCRHPIYLGVLLLSGGVTLSRRSWWEVALFLMLTVFFHLKASFEERRLAEHFPGYLVYAARTSMIIPLPRRSR